jgi:6-phosphogluconolactonase
VSGIGRTPPPFLFASPVAMSATPIAYPVFIGTYGRQSGAGIYRVTFDPTSGALSEPVRVADLVRPSFLSYSPDQRHLYALSQADESVVAFAVDHSIGTLKELNRQPTGFAGACFVITDHAGRTALAVSYGDAAVAAFPVQSDGALGPRTALVRHEGQVGPHAERQDQPHAHSATVTPNDRFVYVCDLGMDRVVAYRLDATSAALTPAPEADGTAPAGAGPRHAKLTADGRQLYVVNELQGSVTLYYCDPTNGRLTRDQTVSALREDFSGENISAEIRLHPHEGFVYVSNRGPDELAVFRRDRDSGQLTRIQVMATGGGHPRNFALSPDGRWLICANRDSNSLTVFAVDPASGHLTRTNHAATVPEPVCVLFPTVTQE